MDMEVGMGMGMEGRNGEERGRRVEGEERFWVRFQGWAFEGCGERGRLGTWEIELGYGIRISHMNAKVLKEKRGGLKLEMGRDIGFVKYSYQ